MQPLSVAAVSLVRLIHVPKVMRSAIFLKQEWFSWSGGCYNINKLPYEVL